MERTLAAVNRRISTLGKKRQRILSERTQISWFFEGDGFEAKQKRFVELDTQLLVVDTEELSFRSARDRSNSTTILIPEKGSGPMPFDGKTISYGLARVKQLEQLIPVTTKILGGTMDRFATSQPGRRTKRGDEIESIPTFDTEVEQTRLATLDVELEQLNTDIGHTNSLTKVQF